MNTTAMCSIVTAETKPKKEENKDDKEMFVLVT